MEVAEPGNVETAKFPFIALIWLFVVFGIPYVILGLIEGFGTSFRSGEASIYMCGAIVAAAGENFLELAENHFSRFRKSKPSVETGSETRKAILSLAVFNAVVTLAILTWNMYFAVQQKTLNYPPLDWMQVVAFIVAAAQIMWCRFMLSDYYFDVLGPYGDDIQGDW